ncbi:MAG: NAD(P)-dependent alcohol dehydrogenase [Actinomycetota bacterium]|nr:NAD(P)-dependent alcohol dehydrogenase [Actinomycetota bacterium]
MKAITQEEYGTPGDVLRLQEIEKPTIGDDDVLVRVRATGIHIGDWLMMNGVPYLIRLMGYGLRKPKATVPGTELAGSVEAIGKNVKQFQPGDEVFGFGTGGFAEYAAVSQDALVLKPANATFEQAAVVPVSGFTALQAVRDQAKVQPGQNVLIIGASGGVGTYAVQIAKAFGAEVTGVCSTRNVEMVRSIGADHVIDYTKENIAESGQRYDVILDMAGNRSISELRSALTPEGTLVIVGGTGGHILMGFGRTLRGVALSPFVSQDLRSFISSTNKDDLVVLKELIEDGKITPVVDRAFPLTETADALNHVGERHTRGKTVVTV